MDCNDIFEQVEMILSFGCTDESIEFNWQVRKKSANVIVEGMEDKLWDLKLESVRYCSLLYQAFLHSIGEHRLRHDPSQIAILS